MAKDGNEPKTPVDKNPAHHTNPVDDGAQQSGNSPKGTDIARGSEGDTRRASKGAR